MSAYTPPTLHHSVLNLTFNNSDFTTPATSNDLKYVKLAGSSTITGSLSLLQNLNVNNTATFNNNITLPSVYAAPSAGQLGNSSTITSTTATAMTSGSTINITSLVLGVGIWAINWGLEVQNTNATSTVITLLNGGIGLTTTSFLPTGAMQTTRPTLTTNQSVVYSGSSIITGSQTVYLNCQSTWTGGVFVNKTSTLTAYRIA